MTLSEAIELLGPLVEHRLHYMEMFGDCETETEEWARALRGAGFEVTRWKGFWVHGPHQIPHYWLRVGEELFDPTAWQFEALEDVDADAGMYEPTEQVP